ncbi:MAG: cation transporter [Stygiobacter sp. RIFOXYA12_FULL_38_9]|nr:MAG: cation transporter [Stygiobacter sp. GWC2_38_9]OGU83499.1 MAG: cation transporter [Stygiobacter sp. RIFOXYA12_FULL_38_9]OGV09970.1 MAG: cation transporter [Stygiobacter sp. RIFOXYA2_FULL_38_8]OGV12905.1 MAG: cation transporter [Stygiobacter sp. RIFOXYC2_FULL_38_25]OGV81838.1 MAG: cation transporter [Stygiobacter sp. GWF2_38_21]RJQ64481.1 MAG: efflux RND transporter permease subunit [Stygiobacter sp.]
MIEKIIDWSANNRFIVILIYLIVIGFGIYSVVNLPVDAIPDLSENQVIIFTEWMGRSPQIIEDQVTYPIVSGLQGLPRVKAVRATSMFGMSFVFVVFEDGVDTYFARTRVLERMNTVQAQLPSGVVPTLGPDGTGVGHVYWYTVEGKGYDLGTLRAVQDWYIRYKLSSVDGVAEVASIGGFVKQYQVDVNPTDLRAYNLTVSDVVNAVQRSNNEVGGKILEVSDAEYFVRGQGYIQSKDDVENTVIKTGSNGIPILIKNVASVSLGGDIRRGALEKNGEGQAVGGIIVMRTGENAQKVIDRVKEKIKEISPGLPPGVEVVTSYDRSTLIKEAIGTLDRALIEAAITVSIMVAIFLLHWRSIVRILIEIPIAVLISFILMYMFDITSNIMSLGGIILAIGVIVDSSIVLVENAYRNIAKAIEEKGSLTADEYKKISIDSAKQVGRAIFFSELIILVSFIPVFLLTGQEGKMFKPLAFTKSFTMIGAAIVVISLIPVLMTMLMRGKFRPEEKNPSTRFFIRIYEPVIHWVLKHRKTTIAINVLALIITVPMILNTGSEFMPPLDEGSILYMPVTLPGASITEVNRILQEQDKLIKSVPEVHHVLGKTGRAETPTDNAPLNMIETIILLKPKDEWRSGITKQDIVAELDSKLQIPGVRNGWTQPIINRINMLATGVRTDIGFKIFGPDLDTLETYAIKAEKLLKKVNGAADVVAERVQNGYYLDIQVKRAIAARYGVNIRDLQDIIETAIGGQNLGIVIEGRMRFPIRMRYQKDYRDNIDELRSLIVPVALSNQMAVQSSSGSMSGGGMGKSNSGGMFSSMGNSNQANVIPQASNAQNDFSLTSTNQNAVTYLPLAELADINLVTGPPMISSENGMLRSIVFMNTRGRDMGSVMVDAKEIIEEGLKLPPGYSYTWSGQYESKVRAQQTMQVIMPVVFLIIFVLLYFTLKDYVEAGVVMLSVPFALIGGMYMIFILGYNFSVAVWVGFIALYGVAVETGVVMVVYLHESLDKRLRAFYKGERGHLTKEDIYDATVEGSVLRLRPKLMTVGTSMVGLIPVMWATGTGSDVMKPLTAPLIGGLLTSAVHVLVVTPILFAMMKERALKKGKLELSKMADWMREGE